MYGRDFGTTRKPHPVTLGEAKGLFLGLRKILRCAQNDTPCIVTLSASEGSVLESFGDSSLRSE